MKKTFPRNDLVDLALTKYTALSLKEISYVTGLSQSVCEQTIAQLLKESSLTSFINRKAIFYKKINVQDSFSDFSPLKNISQAKSPLNEARTCYKHLAGKLGVQVTQALIKKGFIVEKEDKYLPTHQGIQLIEYLSPKAGNNMGFLSGKKCLDWTQRKFHLGGQLGQLLAERYLKLDWIKQKEHSRLVFLTEKGKKEFRKNLGL